MLFLRLLKVQVRRSSPTLGAVFAFAYGRLQKLQHHVRQKAVSVMPFLSCLQASRTTQKLALSFFEQDYLKYVVFLLLFCCPHIFACGLMHTRPAFQKLLPAVCLRQLPYSKLVQSAGSSQNQLPDTKCCTKLSVCGSRLFASCHDSWQQAAAYGTACGSCQKTSRQLQAVTCYQLSIFGSCFLPAVSVAYLSSWLLPMLPAVSHQMLYVPTLRRICQGRNKVLRMNGTMCQFCVYSDYTVK